MKRKRLESRATALFDCMSWSMLRKAGPDKRRRFSRDNCHVAVTFRVSFLFSSLLSDARMSTSATPSLLAPPPSPSLAASRKGRRRLGTSKSKQRRPNLASLHHLASPAAWILYYFATAGAHRLVCRLNTDHLHLPFTIASTHVVAGALLGQACRSTEGAGPLRLSKDQRNVVLQLAILLVGASAAFAVVPSSASPAVSPVHSLYWKPSSSCRHLKDLRIGASNDPLACDSVPHHNSGTDTVSDCTASDHTQRVWSGTANVSEFTIWSILTYLSPLPATDTASIAALGLVSLAR